MHNIKSYSCKPLETNACLIEFLKNEVDIFMTLETKLN